MSMIWSQTPENPQNDWPRFTTDYLPDINTQWVWSQIQAKTTISD